MDIIHDEDYLERERQHKKDAIGKVTSFFLFRNLINNYNQDKSKHHEERKKIKKYGILSVLLSSFALFLSVCCIISNIMDFEFLGFSYVLMVVIYLFSGTILSIILATYAFVFGVMQVRLNRKSIGIIGIALSVLAFASSIFLGIYIFI